MPILIHEIKLKYKAFCIWAGSIVLLILCCLLIFPQMKEQMEKFNDLFAQLGDFTKAFGMDRLNIGTLIGYYATEIGAIIAIGGSFYSAITSISILSREEYEHTAEILYTHPVKRSNVLLQKLLAVFVLVTSLYFVIYISSIILIFVIGEEVPWLHLSLYILANYLVAIVISLICFGISAFINNNGFGVGIGVALVFYFISLIANISENMSFLKYFTPFGFANGADIVEKSKINLIGIIIFTIVCILSVGAAFYKYKIKDIK